MRSEFFAKFVYGFLIDYGLLVWRNIGLLGDSGHYDGQDGQPWYALGTKHIHL